MILDRHTIEQVYRVMGVLQAVWKCVDVVIVTEGSQPHDCDSGGHVCGKASSPSCCAYRRLVQSLATGWSAANLQRRLGRNTIT